MAVSLLALFVVAVVAAVVVTGVLRRSRAPSGGSRTPSPAQMSAQLREQALLATQLVPGVTVVTLMDVGLDNGVVTLLCWSDGSVSLYSGAGGGIIGAGGDANPTIRDAGAALVGAVQRDRGLMTATTEHPLPSVGRTAFLLVTERGEHAAEAMTSELESGTHPLSTLYRVAMAVVHEILTHRGKR